MLVVAKRSNTWDSIAINTPQMMTVDGIEYSRSLPLSGVTHFDFKLFNTPPGMWIIFSPAEYKHPKQFWIANNEYDFKFNKQHKL